MSSVQKPRLTSIMPCSPHSGLGHWLTHQSTKSVPVNGFRILTLDLALATYTEVPLIAKNPVLGYPIVPDKIRHIRHFLYKNNELALHTVCPHSDFFVVPKDYPKEAHSAFGLRNPPSPYELAAAILHPPHRCFWGEAGHKKYSPALRCANSALKWWLLGIPLSLLGKRTSQAPEVLLCQAIEHLCRTVQFKLWASAIDPRALITTRDQARVAASILQGTKLPRAVRKDGTIRKSMNKRYISARKQINKKPLLAAAFQRARIPTIDRPLYTPGIVFRTKQAKLDWLRTPNNTWAEKARYAHRTLYKRKINAHRKRQDQSWNQEHI